jgi:hypothetical protein
MMGMKLRRRDRWHREKVALPEGSLELVYRRERRSSGKSAKRVLFSLAPLAALLWQCERFSWAERGEFEEAYAAFLRKLDGLTEESTHELEALGRKIMKEQLGGGGV